MPAHILVIHDQDERLRQIKTSLEPIHVVTACSGIVEAAEAVKSVSKLLFAAPILQLVKAHATARASL